MNGVHKYLIVVNLLLISVSASGSGIGNAITRGDFKVRNIKQAIAKIPTIQPIQQAQSNPAPLNCSTYGYSTKDKGKENNLDDEGVEDCKQRLISLNQQTDRMINDIDRMLDEQSDRINQSQQAEAFGYRLDQELVHVQNNTDDEAKDQNDLSQAYSLLTRESKRDKRDEDKRVFLKIESSTTSQTTEYDEELQQAIDLSLAVSKPVVFDTLVNQETVPANTIIQQKKKDKETIDEDEYLALEAARESSTIRQAAGNDRFSAESTQQVSEVVPTLQPAPATVNAPVDQDIVPVSTGIQSEADLALNDFQREAAGVSDVQDTMDDTVGSSSLAVYDGEGRSFQEFVAVSDINKCILDMLKIYIEENPSVALQALKLNFGLTDQQLRECGKTPGEIWMHILSAFIWQQKEDRLKAIGNGQGQKLKTLRNIARSLAAISAAPMIVGAAGLTFINNVSIPQYASKSIAVCFIFVAGIPLSFKLSKYIDPVTHSGMVEGKDEFIDGLRILYQKCTQSIFGEKEKD